MNCMHGKDFLEESRGKGRNIYEILFHKQWILALREKRAFALF